jgi:hypothetical protein
MEIRDVDAVPRKYIPRSVTFTRRISRQSIRLRKPSTACVIPRLSNSNVIGTHNRQALKQRARKQTNPVGVLFETNPTVTGTTKQIKAMTQAENPASRSAQFITRTVLFGCDRAAIDEREAEVLIRSILVEQRRYRARIRAANFSNDQAYS